MAVTTISGCPQTLRRPCTGVLNYSLVQEQQDSKVVPSAQNAPTFCPEVTEMH